MDAKTRLAHEARAQANHDEYAQHTAELLDMIDDRDSTIENLESEKEDLEERIEELEADDA